MSDDEFKRLVEVVQTSGTETRRHFDIALERMEKNFELLAESIATVDDGLSRARVALEQKIESTAAETQAMMKFSHRDLDRRVTSLEEAVGDLESRVRRLEDAPH